jgi:LysB family phage lysis regulatory protein
MSAAAMALLQRFGPYLAIALLAYCAWSQHQTISAQDKAISGLQEHAATVAKRISDISHALDLANKNAQDLQRSQDQLRGALSQREIDIRKLQHDTAELQHWADQPLPDTIIRLRQRPAITGSAAYSEYLSSHQPLHAVGEQPPDDRGPQSATGTGRK